ncbi:hypothetical protein DNHGIG_04840 [Collibacillus ludicampi]|uniref:Uncharacterized protein n=1 Tax=Collibacillus ludicampi TaxID=2771369 RepID=A0AAV4LAX9_9BACL|nr:hypothetical protein DNHGIG_04840 [Collibacillus ludicampi]
MSRAPTAPTREPPNINPSATVKSRTNVERKLMRFSPSPVSSLNKRYEEEKGDMHTVTLF